MQARTPRIHEFFAVIVLLCAGCDDDLSTAFSPLSQKPVVVQAAPTPTATCTVTDNGNGTFSAVVFWSDVTVWGLRFFDGASQFAGNLRRPFRSGSGGFSNLSFAPTGVDLLGRGGETLASATCS